MENGGTERRAETGERSGQGERRRRKCSGEHSRRSTPPQHPEEGNRTVEATGRITGMSAGQQLRARAVGAPPEK